jgi:hypothetical protein
MFVPKFVKAVTVLTVPAEVKDPVTAVDTEAIGIVLKAGAPAFAMLDSTAKRAISSCKVSMSKFNVSALTRTSPLEFTSAVLPLDSSLIDICLKYDIFF